MFTRHHAVPQYFAVLCMQVNEFVPVFDFYPAWSRVLYRWWRLMVKALRPCCTRSAAGNTRPSRAANANGSTMAAAGTAPLSFQSDTTGPSNEAPADDLNHLEAGLGPPDVQHVDSTTVNGTTAFAQGKASPVDDIVPATSGQLRDLAALVHMVRGGALKRVCNLHACHTHVHVFLAPQAPLENVRLVGHASMLYHTPIILLWLTQLAILIASVFYAHDPRLGFEGILFFQCVESITSSHKRRTTGDSDVQQELTTVFGESTAPIWTAIAANPAAALGNTTVAFQHAVDGLPIPFTLWNTTWTRTAELPACRDYPPACLNASLGVGGLWQVVDMLDKALLPVTVSYCFSDGGGEFAAYYNVTQVQGQRFRALLGLPAECITPDDPTCSVVFCTTPSTFVVLMVRLDVLSPC